MDSFMCPDCDGLIEIVQTSTTLEKIIYRSSYFEDGKVKVNYSDSKHLDSHPTELKAYCQECDWTADAEMEW